MLVNIGPGNGLVPDGTKPLPEPMPTYCQLDYWVYKLKWNFNQIWKLWYKKMHLKMPSAECCPFCSGPNEVSTSEVFISDPLCGESTFPFKYRAGGFTTQRLHLASVENLIMQIRWSYDYLTRIAGFNTLARWHLDVEARALVASSQRSQLTHWSLGDLNEILDIYV